MSGLLRRTRTVVAAVAVLASALTATAVSTAAAAAADTSPATTVISAAAAVPDTGNVSSSTPTSKVSPQSFSTAAAAESYWTAARMAAAVATPKTTAAPKAPIGSVAPEAIVTTAKLTDIHSTTGTLAAAKPEALNSKVTRPYTNRTDRLNGKVFFNQNGVDYVCSGTVVNSNNKDMIDTAGHCVSDGAGKFVTKWVFVPGYASNPSGGTAGMNPYGIWTARTLTTTAQWHYYGNMKQDLAYGVVAPLSNRHIATYLGGHGTFFNIPRNQVFSAFGYPQASPFNGQDQRVSVSRRNGDDLQLGGSGPAPMKIASNHTSGSSGGGWIVGISTTTGLGHVNGHNSYKYLTGPVANADRMYSPYYGNEALALYNYTKFL